jgi:hypothetical protein
LTYEDILPINDFIYKKWGGLSANIIDRMAYHHFYLVYDMIGELTSTNIDVIINDISHKVFEIDFNDLKFKFEYDFGWHKEKVHNITSRFSGDALETMLTKVLQEDVDFKLNHKRSVFATKLSELVKSCLYGKCAVVGAGIYGITAATKLRTAGYKVDLYDSEDDILKKASGINQYRIHRGYHYPRSPETIESCKSNEESFIKYYNQSIVNNNIKHYYSIASEESLVTPQEYLTVLDKAKLDWKIVETLPNCDLTIEVEEKLYDPHMLSKICHERIKGNGINLILNTSVEKLKGYNYVVYATYASLNNFTDNEEDYQFELCEKPVLKLPSIYQNKSIVIMDGPFMCFDPLADTGYHLGGNVVHAIHASNIGKTPKIPPVYEEYLNKGIVKKPKYTNIDRFIESAKKFFPEIEDSEYIGSMYTIRTVLPYKDDTDERPTIVTKRGNDFILFSSKIGNCVDSSEEILNIIKNEVIEN